MCNKLQPLRFIPTIHGHKIRKRMRRVSVKTLNPFHLHHSHYFYLLLPLYIYSSTNQSKIWRLRFEFCVAILRGTRSKGFQTGVNQQTNSWIRRVVCSYSMRCSSFSQFVSHSFLFPWSVSMNVADVGCVLKVGVITHRILFRPSMRQLAIGCEWREVSSKRRAIMSTHTLHIVTVGRFVTQSLWAKHENSHTKYFRILSRNHFIENINKWNKIKCAVALWCSFHKKLKSQKKYRIIKTYRCWITSKK